MQEWKTWKEHVNYGLSEADLVAEFYHQCRARGWHCELEVTLGSPEHPSGRMRADAVIRRSKYGPIICAVEFKKYGRKLRECKLGGDIPQDTKQQLAYDSQIFPAFYCFGAHGIFPLIDEIEPLFDREPTIGEDEDFWDMVEASHYKKTPIYSYTNT